MELDKTNITTNIVYKTLDHHQIQTPWKPVLSRETVEHVYIYACTLIQGAVKGVNNYGMTEKAVGFHSSAAVVRSLCFFEKKVDFKMYEDAYVISRSTDDSTFSFYFILHHS